MLSSVDSRIRSMNSDGRMPRDVNHSLPGEEIFPREPG